MFESVPKLTLDTNSVINLFDQDSQTATSVETLAALIRYGLSGRVEIAASTRVEADLEGDRDLARREKIRGFLALLPVIGTVVRLDVSQLNGEDVLDGAASSELHAEVQRIVFPGLSTEDRRYQNKLYDIDHLVGHKLASRDIFVTDDRGIWRHREPLKAGPGIIVMLPSECLAYIDEVDALIRPQRFETSGIDPNYYSPRLHGRVCFDYSNNNHRFSLGDGIRYFETRWSKASDTSIHALNDASSISGIALAKDVQDIRQITDASAYDFSTRDRTPSLGQIVIWRNVNGLYAATKILSIKDDARGADRDELEFEYVILAESGRDFS